MRVRFQEITPEKLPAGSLRESCAKLELTSEAGVEQGPLSEPPVSAECLPFGISYRHRTIAELKKELENAVRSANYHKKRTSEMVSANSQGGGHYSQVSISDHVWKAKAARQEAD